MMAASQIIANFVKIVHRCLSLPVLCMCWHVTLMMSALVWIQEEKHLKNGISNRQRGEMHHGFPAVCEVNLIGDQFLCDKKEIVFKTEHEMPKSSITNG